MFMIREDRVSAKKRFKPHRFFSCLFIVYFPVLPHSRLSSPLRLFPFFPFFVHTIFSPSLPLIVLYNPLWSLKLRKSGYTSWTYLTFSSSACSFRLLFVCLLFSPFLRDHCSKAFEGTGTSCVFFVCLFTLLQYYFLQRSLGFWDGCVSQLIGLVHKSATTFLHSFCFPSPLT